MSQSADMPRIPLRYIIGGIAAIVWEAALTLAAEKGWAIGVPNLVVSVGLILPIVLVVVLAVTHEAVLHRIARSRKTMSLLVFVITFGLIGAIAWYVVYKLPLPREAKISQQPSAGPSERVGFLQLDKLEYERGTGFVADKPFTIQVWFTNRGSFPVYAAHVFVLLVTAPSHEGNDARIHRGARKAVRDEWEKNAGSQVAVGGSLYCKSSVSLSQEEIDRIFSGQLKLYYLAFAKWETASGKRVLPQWDECSWFEPPQTRDFNRLTIDWRVCGAAPIPSQVSPTQIRALDELREEGHQMLDAQAGHLPLSDKVSRWMEKAQLSLRTDIPEYLPEFDQAVKEPSSGNEPEAWFNDMDRQVEGRRLAAAVAFLDLVREELYSRLP